MHLEIYALPLAAGNEELARNFANVLCIFK